MQHSKTSPTLYVRTHDLPRLSDAYPPSALDTRAWTAGLTFTVYGGRIGLRSNDAAALEACLPAMPPHWQPSASKRVDWLYSIWRGGDKRPTFTLYSNDEQKLRTRVMACTATWFHNDVQLAVARTARRKILIHAGVVAWRGQAVVMAGRSFAGKSTLVKAMLRAGAVYYSDEYAVLDERGRVHPFARPLALREPEYLRRNLLPQELGARVGRKPLPVALVLLATYRANGRWRPQRLTPGRGAFELLRNSFNARENQQEALKTLAQVTLHAPVWQGIRGDAAQVVEWVQAELGRR